MPSSGASSDSPVPAGQLLDEVLNSLLEDFDHWYRRGQVLLAHCPDAVMDPSERQELGQALERAARELEAARALRGAVPEPMALDLQAMAPWHRLVLRVWALSTAMRRAGVAMPERE